MLKSFFFNNKILRTPFLLTRRLYALYFHSKKEYILSRTACLGNDSMKIAFKEYKIINNQKSRIDYISSILCNENKIKFSFKINNLLNRSDIYELYIQQVFNKWSLKRSPNCIVFDSYSELTDQKFVSKSNFKINFFTNYTDLNKSFQKEFVCEGLLNVEELFNHYLEVFNILSYKYPNVPIIFIHFPKKLETRNKFIKRHDDIKNAIISIKQKIKNFHIIDIPESIVNFNEKDSFPYHFSDETYNYVTISLKCILFKYKISC
jgi:hypothetical protein